MPLSKSQLVTKNLFRGKSPSEFTLTDIIDENVLINQTSSIEQLSNMYEDAINDIESTNKVINAYTPRLHDGTDTTSRQPANRLNKVVFDRCYDFHQVRPNCTTGNIDKARDRSNNGIENTADSNSNKMVINQRRPAGTDTSDPTSRKRGVSLHNSVTLVPKTYSTTGNKQHQTNALQESNPNKKLIDNFVRNFADPMEANRTLNHDQRNASTRQNLRKQPSISLMTFDEQTPRTSEYDFPSNQDHRLSYGAAVMKSMTRFDPPADRRLNKQTKASKSGDLTHAQKPQHLPPIKDERRPSHPLLDLKQRFLPKRDSYFRKQEVRRRFENFTANLVPINLDQNYVGTGQQRKWLESQRRLSKTHQTSYIDVTTTKQLYREDCKKAFATVRISMARRSPAVIASPTAHALQEMPTEDLGRHPWCWEPRKYTRLDTLINAWTSRFYPWAAFDPAKVRSTVCYFKHLAPSHLNPEPPARLLREEQHLHQQYEKNERARKLQESQHRRRKLRDSRCTPFECSGNITPSTEWSATAAASRAGAIGQIKFIDTLEGSGKTSNKLGFVSKKSKSLPSNRPGLTLKRSGFALEKMGTSLKRRDERQFRLRLTSSKSNMNLTMPDI
ncbi:hypothetical protein ElyMa_003347700 [Elysia marginata]|uniref:Uncharacterized protein n=1 Tax=Elysia marginata TaxID=1093978 RepID=A0AAV4JGI8_9GAST|nr:hypothetical protein ElyMa_003347700 [Elysia marginata]